METALLEKLRNSPKLKLYLEEIQEILSAEQEKRKQFYRQIKEDDKAEFLNGEIIYHTPVRLSHNTAVKLLTILIDNYVRINDLGYVGIEKIMVSFTRNDYEPDICFFKREKSRLFKPNQVKFPVPDFVAEILSPGPEHFDREVKFEDYAAHGVGEYWIIDPDQQILEQYVLKGEEYQLLSKSGSGTVKSRVIEGFEIPIPAIFSPDENLNFLKRMLK